MIKKIKKKIENKSKERSRSKISKYVLDTSVIIERIVSKEISNGKLKGTFIIPNAVVSELEHQANQNQEIGYIGLDELSELTNLAKTNKIKIEFQGPRPEAGQIKHAKFGEIDALIRELALKNNAELITADYVQAKSAEAYGTPVFFIKALKLKKSLLIEKYFEKDIMSLHLKENSLPLGKKGFPGSWKLVPLSKRKLTKENLQKFSKEIIEKSRMLQDSFVEISKPSLTVSQYGDLRIVIVKPPLSDGYEITVTKPIKKLSIKDYNLNKKTINRFEKARGIILAGEAGSGKSTFVQSLAEFYSGKGFIVKTIESPRDLQLSEEITQYGKNFAGATDLQDILFLSRPDYVIFDEMRSTPDFSLYSDLRLSGSECIGVMHSASPIDSVQRFIGRLEIGMIPSVIDTIIYMAYGKIQQILSLSLEIKVPSGMKKADLVRPVIDVRDFETNELLYEIYKYGEEAVVSNISKRKLKKSFFIEEDKRNIVLLNEPGKYSLYLDQDIISEIVIRKNGFFRISKKSKLGKKLINAIINKQSIDLK